MTTDTGVTGATQIGTMFSTTEIKTYYIMALLDRALPRLYHCNFAQRADIPERAGGTAEFRKFSSLSVATTALTPGVTPTSTAAEVTNITVTPAWYGSYIRFSQEFKRTAIDNILEEFIEMLGEQAGNTADQLARALFVASGTAQIVGQSLRTSLTTSDTMTGSQMAKAYSTLLASNARPFEEIDGRYAVIMHPHVWYDLQESPDFRNAYQQAQPRSEDHPLFTGEMYDYMGMRIFVTSNGYYETDGGASTVDAYVTLVIGQNAFGIAGIGATGFDMELGMGGTGNPPMPVDIKAHPIGEATPSDPLGQRGSVGWIASQQEVELDSTFCVRVECASSMGSN